jgi:hypothetical protein
MRKQIYGFRFRPFLKTVKQLCSHTTAHVSPVTGADIGSDGDLWSQFFSSAVGRALLKPHAYANRKH